MIDRDPGQARDLVGGSELTLEDLRAMPKLMPASVSRSISRFRSGIRRTATRSKQS